MSIKTINTFLILALAALFAWSLLRPNLLSGKEKKSAIETPARMQEIAAVPNKLGNWPPVVGKEFPAVELFDHMGNRFNLSDLSGRPTLIEFVAMTCAACQAWSGANEYGAFENLASQGGLESIEKYFPQYTGGLKLFNGPVNFVQLVIYDTSLRAPTADHLAAWREHFHLDKYPNVFVVSGGESLANKDSFVRIPGFMLLDKELIVRYDALGHRPVHNLYQQLLPAVKTLL